MFKKTDGTATLSMPQAAKFAGVGVGTIRAAVGAGQIPVLRIGKRLRVLRVPFEDLLLTGGFGPPAAAVGTNVDEGGAPTEGDR